jgi:nitrogen regulatory protein PII
MYRRTTEMKEIKAIIQPFMLGKVCEALREIEDLPGLTVSQVMGWGKARAAGVQDVVKEGGCVFAKKTKIEMVLPSHLVEEVVQVVSEAAHTGKVGDGKLFVYDVQEVVKIRTGQTGEDGI